MPADEQLAVPSFELSIDQEIILFSSLKDLKLAGVHKHLRMIRVLQRFGDALGSKSVTSEAIWNTLSKYYRLEDIDAVENDLNECAPKHFSAADVGITVDPLIESKGGASKDLLVRAAESSVSSEGTTEIPSSSTGGIAKTKGKRSAKNLHNSDSKKRKR